MIWVIQLCDEYINTFIDNYCHEQRSLDKSWKCDTEKCQKKEDATLKKSCPLLVKSEVVLFT